MSSAGWPGSAGSKRAPTVLRDTLAAFYRLEAQVCRREHRAAWVVVQRHYNASAFNGYHRTPSAYSALRCLICRRYWRSKAAYVADIPDA